MMNEKAIIQQLRSGDIQALKEIWDANSTNVLNLAFRMLLDRDSAEDILMDVFAGLPDAIANFRGESSLSTWLYRLTKNACLMKLRSGKRHLEIIDGNRGEVSEYSVGADTPEMSSIDSESLQRGLAVLTPEVRSLLWLKDAEGLDLKSLTAIFEAPEGTLKARLSRARAQVRSMLQKEMNYA